MFKNLLLLLSIFALVFCDTLYRDIETGDDLEDLEYLLDPIGEEYEYGMQGETVATSVDSVGGTIAYTLGKRRAGDRIVAASTKKQQWATQQNVTVTLQYPTSTTYGLTLSYLYVQVNQTSNLGRAYVISGGIGQRFVQLAVESDFTFTMDYTAYFYGY